MRGDSRLSRMLHVLIHLDQSGEPMTSEFIGEMLGTNAVVVRRTMAGLRDHGHVQSVKGHGGGWTLARPLAEITLLDVYKALEEPELFCFVPSKDHAECLVERAVNDALMDTREAAERLMLERFAAIRLSDIARDFEGRMAQMKHRSGCGAPSTH